MKTNRDLTVKILFVSLGVLLVLYYTLTRQDGKRYDWTENYKTTSEQPYGTLFIQKLLSSYRPGESFILNDKKTLHSLLDTSQIKTPTSYVFIGQDIFLDEADKDALLYFISSGNDVFLATINLPFDIIDPIFLSECNKTIFLVQKDTLSATMNFYNTNLETKKGYTYSYRFGKADNAYYWNALNPEVFCDSTRFTTPLGFIHPDRVNFFRMAYGKGNLYVHTNPLVFTNYFLTKSHQVEYASSVFSHLKKGPIIWDEFSKSTFAPRNNAPEVSPISYILQQESLRYAWWMMLAAAVLYTLFTAKRKQRIIAVLADKANTSLEYVKMISALHFRNGNHHDIARKKIRYFLYFIRARYGIHIQNFTEAHVKRLAEKSKVQLADLQTIVSEFAVIERQQFCTANGLVDLHNALDSFYKQCK